MNRMRFAKLVRDMRTAQVEFVMTHTRSSQERARSLERRVDRALRRYSNEGYGSLKLVRAVEKLRETQIKGIPDGRAVSDVDREVERVLRQQPTPMTLLPQ